MKLTLIAALAALILAGCGGGGGDDDLGPVGPALLDEQFALYQQIAATPAGTERNTLIARFNAQTNELLGQGARTYCDLETTPYEVFQRCVSRFSLMTTPLT